MRKEYIYPICDLMVVEEEDLLVLGSQGTDIKGENPEGIGDDSGPSVGGDNEELGAKGSYGSIFDD